MTDFLSSKLHPVLRTWFLQKYGRPTDVQLRAWQAIAAGRHTLIASPTGSGKTLAALLPCFDALVRAKEEPCNLQRGVRILYVTPLKALNNDIHLHMAAYLQEMREVAAAIGQTLPEVRIGVRTGDTTSSQRTAMLREPPDVLVTTPESLYVLLTSFKGRDMLQNVERVIVDEIHDLAATKRGMHLSLSLERLVHVCGHSPLRIGVSATQRPLSRVAQYLGGWECITADMEVHGSATNAIPRQVEIVEAEMAKGIEIEVRFPRVEHLDRTKDNFWTPIVKEIARLLEPVRTGLVFVNNRRLCERLTLRLNDYFGYEAARSHHGSVSREKRLEVERLLKSGQLKCIVATASLELGIDVGHVDVVVQMDSPLQAAAGVQRIGRAGHSVGGTSRGVVVAKTRAELPEIAVLARLISDREIEEIRIPKCGLDVLAQHVVSCVATEEWRPDELYQLVLRSDSYRGLPFEWFEEMVKVLTGLFPFVRPLLEWDAEQGVLRRRPNTSMAALMGAGAIPQNSSYPVHHASSRVHLGELDEEFVHESRTGDVFQLGTSSWMIQSIQHNAVYVVESNNRLSEIPFWRGGTIGRSVELGQRVGTLLEQVDHKTSVPHNAGDSDSGLAEAMAWLQSEYYLDDESAKAICRTVCEQRAQSALPTHRDIVVETFRDEVGQGHMIIHSLFGKRFNRTWMFALQRALEGRAQSKFYANAKDNGIQFVFTEWEPSITQVIWEVTEINLESLILEALPSTPQFSIVFRQMAETSLFLARKFGRSPAWLQRLRSEELLREALLHSKQFPLVRAAIAECLRDSFDVDAVKTFLSALIAGEIRLTIRDTAVPSPMARMFLAEFAETKLYESDVLKPDLQNQLLSLNRELAVEVFGENALKHAIDAEVVESERIRLEQGELDNVDRTSQDVYQLLKQRGEMTTCEMEQLVGAQAAEWLAELRDRRQIDLMLFPEARWICCDELPIYESLEHDASAQVFVLNRYIDWRLTFTAHELSTRYPVVQSQIASLLAEWQEQSRIEPALFLVDGDSRSDGIGDVWSSQKVVSRLVRMSVQKARKAAEPQDTEGWMRHLAVIHHLTPQRRLTGIDGLRQVIEDLQGLFLPASHWESIVFPARIQGYRKEDLDFLCASGEILWLGRRADGQKEGSIAFFTRDSEALYGPLISAGGHSTHPDLYDQLTRKGASFLSSLQVSSGTTPLQLLDALFELVWEGRVSNDQFAPLRHYLQGTMRKSGRVHAAVGRWYCLDSALSTTVEAETSAAVWANQLLRQHGLVSKSTVSDDVPFRWDTLKAVMSRFEEWGTVTRGLFLREVPAMQFATREFATRLRQPPIERDLQGVVLVSSVDPANPYGRMIAWPKRAETVFSRKIGNFLVLLNGTWSMWLENNGRRIWTMNERDTSKEDTRAAIDADENAVLRDTFRQLFLQSSIRKVKIESWNGQSVLNTSVADVLRALGAKSDGQALVLWR